MIIKKKKKGKEKYKLNEYYLIFYEGIINS